MCKAVESLKQGCYSDLPPTSPESKLALSYLSSPVSQQVSMKQSFMQETVLDSGNKAVGGGGGRQKSLQVWRLNCSGRRRQ